jgi:hypothetical protein
MSPILDDEDEDDDDTDDEVRRFVTALVADEKILLAGDLSELADLEPMADDPEQLYEALLDSPTVEEVFLSETEFLDLFRKFRLSP